MRRRTTMQESLPNRCTETSTGRCGKLLLDHRSYTKSLDKCINGANPEVGDLLLVVLDRVGAASLHLVWVEIELLAAPALAQQVPTTIELDLHGAQPLPV